jgi:bacterioferritin-associated ferredoxin
MYICICKGITDGQIRQAVNNGAASLDEVRDLLGVASQCGKCACLAKNVIHESMGIGNQGGDLFYAAG